MDAMPLDARQRSLLYVMGQFLLIGLFAVAVLLAAPTPNPVWHGVAFAICLPGIVTIVAALWAMGRVMQVSPEPKQDGHLVTRGIYGWLRHPMYTGIVIIVIGLLVRTPAVAPFLIGVSLIAMLLTKARFEEELLRARYPDYEAYRAHTWGVIPGIGRTRG